MAIEATKLESLLREAFPDADVRIEDLRGDGEHYAAYVVSSAFQGLSRVQQHQLVYKSLKDHMQNVHALAIQTSVPD